jgi:hypothetical protein
VYFNNKSKTNNGILQVDDNFATLVNITPSIPDPRAQYSGDELQFEFVYKVSQIKAIEENALSVAITVKSINKSRPVIVTSRKLGVINTDDLLDNILTHRTKVNNILLNESNSIIAYKRSDITSKINNQVLSYLKAKQPLDNVGFQKTKILVQKIDQKESEEPKISGIIKQELGHATLNDTNLDINKESFIDSKAARLDLIQKKSISPTIVTSIADRSISTNQKLKGLSRKSSHNEYPGSPITALTNSYLFSGQNLSPKSEYVTSVSQTYDDTITIKTKILIKNDVSSQKNNKNQLSSILNVKFELLKSSNESSTTPVEIIEKNLNVEDHIKKYLTPREAPSVSAFKNGSNVVLQIKQNDDRSSGVKIYKRSFSISDKNMHDPYELIDQVGLSKEIGIGRFSYTNFNQENVIYRIVPYNKFSPNFVSSNFSDVLINNNSLMDIKKKLIIIPQITESGIKVVAYNTFSNIVAANLLIRDVTVRQKNYTIVNDVFQFQSSNSTATLTLSKNLIPYHVYELTTKIIENNGVESISSYSTLIEYVPFTGNPFDIEISEVLNSGDDIQFSVSANLVQDQIGVFRDLLNQVNASYDEAQLTSRKANFDKFIAFNIVRYNLSTGDVENLGIIPNKTTFVDSQRSKLYSAKSLTYNNHYKYAIFPLVRDPNTVISQIQEMTDVETKKKYKMNPRKHLHPISLIRGSVVPKRVIEQESDPKEDMLYGFIGTSYQVEASFVGSKPVINLFSASFLGNRKVYLAWTIQGDQSLIDHLIISREIDGVRRIIGKSHTLSREQATFVYEISHDDIGYVKFIITPVYMDFSSGSEAISDGLLITDID